MTLSFYTVSADQRPILGSEAAFQREETGTAGIRQISQPVSASHERLLRSRAIEAMTRLIRQVHLAQERLVARVGVKVIEQRITFNAPEFRELKFLQLVMDEKPVNLPTRPQLPLPGQRFFVEFVRTAQKLRRGFARVELIVALSTALAKR